jgi:hypothetical protein
MATPAPNIFDTLAQHDTQLAQHDQGVSQSKDVFDQIAANGGKALEPPPEQQQPSGVHAGGGKYNSYLDMALGNSPSGADPHNPGNPNLNAVPESERGNVNDTAMNTAMATTPLGVAETPGLTAPKIIEGAKGPAGRDAAGRMLPWVAKKTAEEGPSLLAKGAEHIKDILPEGASVEQAAKIAKIIYHTGMGTGMATYLWHELFGGK